MTGVVQWTAGFMSAPVQVAVTDGQGGRVVHGFYIYVETPLNTGNPIHVDGVEGQTAFASLAVTAGAPYLQITLRSGIGDADLWVADPRGVYVGASFNYANTETLTIPAPIAGTWHIEVDGYRNYTGVTLLAAMPKPIELAYPAASLFSISGDTTSETIYHIAVPAGEAFFNVNTTGGSGDVDLYLRRSTVGCNSLAGTINPCRYDSRSATKGNTEKVTVTNPAAGDYYLDVYGTQQYASVNLTLSAGPGLAVSPAKLSFTATAGGAAPAPQTMNISERSGNTLLWQASGLVSTPTGGTWLNLTPSDGDNTTALTVSVVTTGLTAGTYTGTVTVTASGMSGSPFKIPVTLTVN